MNDAAAALLGEHDFAAFCKRREGATTVRTLLELSWERRAVGRRRRRRCAPTPSATAWCASLVGCLLAVGEGRRARRAGPAEVLAAGARPSSVRWRRRTG